MDWGLLLVIIAYLVLVGFPLVMCSVDDKQYFGWPHAADEDESSKTMHRRAGTAGDAEVAKLQWHGDANDLAGPDVTVRAEQRDDIGDELPAIGVPNRSSPDCGRLPHQHQTHCENKLN